jgi:hypothetical protein
MGLWLLMRSLMAICQIIPFLTLPLLTTLRQHSQQLRTRDLIVSESWVSEDWSTRRRHMTSRFSQGLALLTLRRSHTQTRRVCMRIWNHHRPMFIRLLHPASRNSTMLRKSPVRLRRTTEGPCGSDAISKSAMIRSCACAKKPWKRVNRRLGGVSHHLLCRRS